MNQESKRAETESAGKVMAAAGEPIALVKTDGSGPAAATKNPHWTGGIPVSSHGVMAVVGDHGYLIPVWTAGDLLRACKAYWRSMND